MNQDASISNLEELLDRIGQAGQGRELVSLGAVLEMVGQRSFGPILLVAGVVTLVPVIGGIPGVPTAMGVIVILVVGQMLFHRRHFWLPNWLLKRTVPHDKLQKGVKWMRRPARFVDRLLHPRLQVLTGKVGTYVAAVVCVIVAAMTPLMELIPFSVSGAGAAWLAFGLSLIADDGLLALLALAATLATTGVLIYSFW